MFVHDFCPHCGTFHPENWQLAPTETEQDGEQVVVSNTCRCKHCKGLYKHVEVFNLLSADSILIHEEN